MWKYFVKFITVDDVWGIGLMKITVVIGLLRVGDNSQYENMESMECLWEYATGRPTIGKDLHSYKAHRLT
jgi:hypothetical protein